MKTLFVRSSILVLFLLLIIGAQAQSTEEADSTGLPGDDFSLQGALDLFKNAPDLESFEKALNTDGNAVNNLDLDGNGEIDYVRVETAKDGDAAAIMLRVAVDKSETQDVAVIELEKTGAQDATVQIRGDDDLYPAETIVEPFAENNEVKGGKGPAAPELVAVRVVVNVWTWRPVPWFFGVSYSPWVSPWHYGYYPGWWRPWRPHPWRAWWGMGVRYRTVYRPWNACRVVHAHAIYAPRRQRSAVVETRYREVRVRHDAARPARGPQTAPARPARGKAAKPGRMRKGGAGGNRAPGGTRAPRGKRR